MKRTIALACAVLMMVSTGCGNSAASSTPASSTPVSSSQQAESPSAAPISLNFTMPTGSMGGSYYNSGTAMAQVLNAHVPGMEMSISASNTQDNISMLESGEVDFAMAGGTDYFAVTEKMPSESDTISSMGVFNQLVSMIVVAGNSDYQSLEDLKGKKIQMGSSGSGQCLGNTALIEQLGLTTNDFKCEYMSQSDGTQAFTEGKIEGNLVLSGVPSSLLTQIAASDKNFKILTWDYDFLTAFTEAYPFYKICTVNPEDINCNNITEPTKMAAAYGEVLVRTDVDEEIVYQMCKALFENYEELCTAYAGCAFFTPENTIVFTSYNLHPGAARYFKEIGII